jgi:hypothetical protein
MPLNVLTQPDNVIVQGQFTVTDDPMGNPGKIQSDYNQGATPLLSTDGKGNLTVNTLIGGIAGQLSLSRNTGTGPATTTGGTISTAQSISRVAPAGAITGVILSPGTKNGQVVFVVNEAAFSITMAAAATSNVKSGTTNVIPANAGATYVWDDQAATPIWNCVGMGL